MNKNKYLMIIDITTVGFIRIGLLNDEKIIKVRSVAYKHGSSFLTHIIKYFSLYNLNENFIKGVALIEGLGSFSAARAGVAVLSTLQFTKGVPVAVFDCRVYKSEKELFVKIKNFQWKKKHLPIFPIYQFEPNITIPKKFDHLRLKVS